MGTREAMSVSHFYARHGNMLLLFLTYFLAFKFSHQMALKDLNITKPLGLKMLNPLDFISLALHYDTISHIIYSVYQNLFMKYGYFRASVR
jgi:hypothetical protein